MFQKYEMLRKKKGTLLLTLIDYSSGGDARGGGGLEKSHLKGMRRFIVLLRVVNCGLWYDLHVGC